MLKPVRMQKIVLLATKGSESRLISALHRLGAVQINHLELGGLEKGKPLEAYDDISRELVRVRSLISALSHVPGQKKQPVPLREEPEYGKTLAEARSIAIDEELGALIKSRSDLAAQKKELEARLADLSRLSAFPEINFSRLATKKFTFTLGALKKEAFPKFRKDLEDYLPNSLEISHSSLGKERMAVLVFYPRDESIDFVLARYGFDKYQLPQGFTTFGQGKKDLEARLAAAKSALAQAESGLQRLRESNLERLLKMEKALSVLADRSTMAARFASGRKLVALSGWLTKSDLPKLEAMLRKDFSGETELLRYEDEHGAPILLDNPKNISQFQFLVEFYSLPSYTEFDPTIILLFTVPIMYGMILGDVGYGIISALLSMWILSKYKGGLLGNVAKIWLFSSAAAMFFGVVFDEWFGFTHFHIIELLNDWGLHLNVAAPFYHGLGRAEYLSLILGLSLVAGIAQLSLGFILGALNAWHHDKRHAAAKIAWLAALLGGSFAVCTFMFNLFPPEVGNIAAGVLGLAFLAIVATEGVAGVFEIPGLAANTLSYARIAATGVAGVIIAEMINHNFAPTKENLVFLPAFIILHILNAGLAMFESIVQGSRLNLVEFYSKFFHGGGKAFEPFAMEGLKQDK